MKFFKFCFFLIVSLFVFVNVVNAQTTDTIKSKKDSIILNKITDIDSRLKDISIKDTNIGFSAPVKIDTTYAFRIYESNLNEKRDENGLLIFDPEWIPFDEYVTFLDTIIYDPVFLPVIFDGKILPEELDFLPKDTIPEDPLKQFYLISPDSTFAPQIARAKHARTMRRYYYKNNPAKVKLNALEFKNIPVIKEEVIEKKNPFQVFISADDSKELGPVELEKTAIPTVSWMTETHGTHQIKISQQNFSDNWSGDNNFKMENYHKLTFNFKKRKYSINNVVEWRLNAQKIPGDSTITSKYIVLDDFLRTYSTLGLTSFIKRWKYSSSLEMKTPLFKKYKVRDKNKVRQRALFAPFELNLGVGMTYEIENTAKSNKDRKFKFKADLSVLSINYKYVADGGPHGVQPSWFGIEQKKDENGKVIEAVRSQTDYGSTFNINMTYVHNKIFNFVSRAKYFTNYERAYLEWENTINFQLNRYLAASIYIYLKFNDEVKVERKSDRWLRYFSYNQMSSFGLSYNW